MRDIVLKEIVKKDFHNEKGEELVRLSFYVQIINNNELLREEELWFETKKEFSEYLSADRCDGFIVMILLTAMLEQTTRIKSDYPISQKLWYNLTYHVIPQLVIMDRRKFKNLTLEIPTTKDVYSSKEIGVGMSRGVDSFATFYEYYDFLNEDYKLTSLTYYNVGAHHGQGVKGRTMNDRFWGQLQGTEKFCQDYNYPLLSVNSNLYFFLKKITNKNIRFDQTHTYRNLGCTLLFQRYFKKYYYSSTYNLDKFKAKADADCAYYEKWLIPLLGTENTEFYNANQALNRIEKTKMIAEQEGCYKHLLVCFSEDENCGKCAKCKRTLMQIDALGKDIIENFKYSFDINEYKSKNREKWFDDIDNLMVNGMMPMTYKETFYEAAKNNPQLVAKSKHIKLYDNPIKLEVTAASLAVREHPFLESTLLTRIPKGYQFLSSMECHGWCKIILDDGTIGWSSKRYLKS